MALSRIFWFTSPLRPAVDIWKVSRHRLIRSAWSRTSFMLLPPIGISRRFSQACRLRPSSISRLWVRIASV